MAGEMSKDDVTREGYPLHFAIADALDGTVEPFDVYQGPYIDIDGTRLWITGDGTAPFARVYNERTEASSPLWLTVDPHHESTKWLAVHAAKIALGQVEYTPPPKVWRVILALEVEREDPPTEDEIRDYIRAANMAGTPFPNANLAGEDVYPTIQESYPVHVLEPTLDEVKG